MPELYKTKEVLKKSGLHRQMFYHYLSLGLVIEAKKTPAGHRLFDKRVFKRLALIKELNESGYTLRDMKETFKKFGSQ